MKFSELVEVYEELEATPKRLEMTEILQEFLQRVPPESIQPVVYLTQGILRPEYEGVEMGLGEKLILRALAFTTGLAEGEVEEAWKRLGDLGSVAEEALQRKRQRTLFASELTVEKVYDNLLRVARAEGSGSQEEKIKRLADLLHDASPREARFILRTVVGKMRLGVADMTLVDALAAAFASKEDRDAVERAYNVSSDLGRVARVLAEEGLAGLEDVHMRVGVPVRAMLAERLPSLEEVFGKLGRPALEYKYDGLRIQAHVEAGEVRLFSRRLEDLTAQFPDLVEGLREAFRGDAAVLEGEAVPVDVHTGAFLPFQAVSTRRGRKYGLEAAIEETPVHLLLFDCLYRDGEELLGKPYAARREAVEACIEATGVVGLAEVLVTDRQKEAEAFFDTAVERGCEGLIAKDLASPYKAGARGWQWIKVKRDYKAEMADTVDLVAVGAFAGRGRRAGTYGALLMAAYDPEEDRFRTVCKLGSGFDDETLFALPDRLKKHRREEAHPRVVSELEADAWFEPAVVLEVLGAELTLSPIHTAARGALKEEAGLAIRFPRFTGRWRDDKAPRDATSEEELLAMYRGQMRRAG